LEGHLSDLNIPGVFAMMVAKQSNMATFGGRGVRWLLADPLFPATVSIQELHVLGMRLWLLNSVYIKTLKLIPNLCKDAQHRLRNGESSAAAGCRTSWRMASN